MSVNEIRRVDAGTVITATLRDDTATVDISGAATKYFLLKKPAGSITTITASFVGSGTSGAMKFTSTAAHFDTEGTYQLQGFISDGTNSWHTDIYQFIVHPNLD